MRFTKSRLLIWWLDPSTCQVNCQVKHAYAIKFDEYCTPTSIKNDHIPPSSLLLQNQPSTLNLPEVNINISYHPTFDAPIFQLHILLPPKELKWAVLLWPVHTLTCPALAHLSKLLPLPLVLFSMSLTTLPFGFWVSMMTSSIKTNLVLFILVHRAPTARSHYADNRAIFNQIKLSCHPTSSDIDPNFPTIVSHGSKVIVLSDRPASPGHIGQLSTNPPISDWKEAIYLQQLFQNAMYRHLECLITKVFPPIR